MYRLIFIELNNNFIGLPIFIPFKPQTKYKENSAHHFNCFLNKPGVFTTLQSVSMYKWARVRFDIGVNTIDDVYEIYAVIKQKDLNPNDKSYLKAGFNREWQ